MAGPLARVLNAEVPVVIISTPDAWAGEPKFPA